MRVRFAPAPTTRDRLTIDTAVSELVLVKFLHNEITKVGYRRAVIGLSGGVDSALACALAARALGPDNVLALCLPHRNNAPESIEHAGLVVDALGIQSETADITAVVDALADLSAEMTPRRLGNAMARTRMLLLYDRSAAWDALVVGTSNKTELLLGYGTVYGDLASAVNPVGDLYKTQVRQLARALGVPDVIIDKAPTADLIPGQTDEDDLGFTYEEVDQLLYLIIDERYGPSEAINAGFAPPLVRRVMELVRRSQFKRSLPIIPKLSNRSITHDFRYLRDWGT